MLADTKREQFMAYLERLVDRLRGDLAKCQLDLFNVVDTEDNLKRLPKLILARNSACALLRSARKDDYTLLKADNCPEVDALRTEDTQISDWQAYIFEKRQEHRSLQKERVSSTLGEKM
jgi:hypothetical protein